MAGGGKGVTAEGDEDRWVTTSVQAGKRTSCRHCAVKSDAHKPTSAFAVARTPLAFATSFSHTLPHSLPVFPSPMFGKGSPVAVPKYAAGRLGGSLSLGGVQQIQVKNIRFTSWYRG